jgi:hypothetical protein
MARCPTRLRHDETVRETVLRHIEVDPVLRRFDEGKTLKRFRAMPWHVSTVPDVVGFCY